MTFEDQLKALVFFHLEEHTSARHLMDVLEKDSFARAQIAPPEGINRSSFSEAINSRGLEQLTHVFNALQAQATATIPAELAHLGNLVAIDGSLIDAVLSMTWADYRDGSKKAKIHLGFDLNRSIPKKLYLTNGKDAERPFVAQIISENQTAVLDRGYQCHEQFDQWQTDGKHFICRIKASTTQKCIAQNQLNPGSNQTAKPVRVIAYRVDGKLKNSLPGGNAI